jgi:hypothetical protein
MQILYYIKMRPSYIIIEEVKIMDIIKIILDNDYVVKD